LRLEFLGVRADSGVPASVSMRDAPRERRGEREPRERRGEGEPRFTGVTVAEAARTISKSVLRRTAVFAASLRARSMSDSLRLVGTSTSTCVPGSGSGCKAPRIRGFKVKGSAFKI
jgi:hypothetical protein